jgi:OmpA-OmpF porin, OOP family
MRRAALAAALLLLAPAASRANDVAGSKDFPLVGRYQGSQISFYNRKDFDEAWLLKAPLDAAAISNNSASAHGGAEWQKQQGRVTAIRYDGPEGRSSLEIMTNLQDAMAAKGFKAIFACADEECFAGNLRDSYLLGWNVDEAQENGRYAGHARYALSSLERPEGTVYVAMLVGEAGSNSTVFLRIVEAKPMESGKVVVVDADAMQKSLDASGRVALYGIFFDTDRDVLKPESKPTLEQIAKLLKANAALKLIVTGHTDNQGAFDYNVDLSRRRAAAVVAALVGQYGIGRDRLTPFGAGMAAPAASNETDDGRAKNRRVELVEK